MWLLFCKNCLSVFFEACGAKVDCNPFRFYILGLLRPHPGDLHYCQEVCRNSIARMSQLLPEPVSLFTFLGLEPNVKIDWGLLHSYPSREAGTTQIVDSVLVFICHVYYYFSSAYTLPQVQCLCNVVSCLQLGKLTILQINIAVSGCTLFGFVTLIEMLGDRLLCELSVSPRRSWTN